jgi:hypothetical protein
MRFDPAFEQSGALLDDVIPNIMSKPILFYDMATGLDTSVSWNILKTKSVRPFRSKHDRSNLCSCRRFNLIYKRISFETVWVPFADIESVSKEHGFPPTSTAPNGSAFYTLPAIRDQETGKVLSDSFEIAKYLDERYPARPVIPRGTEDQQAAFVGALMSVIGLVRRAPASGVGQVPDMFA